MKKFILLSILSILSLVSFSQNSKKYHSFNYSCKVGLLGLTGLTNKWFLIGPNIKLSTPVDKGVDLTVNFSALGPFDLVWYGPYKKVKVKDIIVVRNFDYDGKTYLHQLQNLYYWLTNGQELIYTP